MATTTTVRAVRGREVCQLVQKRSPTGIPCCVNCLKPIPKHYREWRDRPLFCRDTCAIRWAEWAAGQVYHRTDAPKEDSDGSR